MFDDNIYLILVENKIIYKKNNIVYSKQIEKNNDKYVIQSILNNKFYHQINLYFISLDFIIVPLKYYKIFENENKYNFQSNINDINAKILYNINNKCNNILNILKKDYTRNLKTFHTALFIIQESIKRDNINLNVNLIDSYLEVCLANNKKLIFYNIFKLENKYGIVYYCALILKNIYTNNEKIYIILYGDAYKYKKIMKKYFTNIFINKKNIYSIIEIY